MNEVVVIYNPYKCQCRMIINDSVVSNYSSLVGFMNIPFHKWCDIFVPKLENEINGKYNLKFISRKTEIDIMRFYISRSNLCQNFIAEDFILNGPLTKRMSSLNKLILNKLAHVKTKTIIKSLFYIAESLDTEKQYLESLEIKNQYCEVTAKVTTQAINADESTTFFRIVQNINDAKAPLEQYKSRKTPWFTILVGNDNKFVGKENNCFIFQTTKLQFMECIFECFLFIPLLNAFLLAKKEAFDIRLQDAIEYKLLDEVDPVIDIKAQAQVEVGQAILLIKELYPHDADEVELTYKYEPENIAFCDGRVIKGIAPGYVKILIYKKGELIPIKTLEINVVKIKRIEQIFIDESYIQLPVGGTFKLNDSYIPEDAENYSGLRWVSENKDIAAIDYTGCVYAKRAGVTRVKRIIDRIETGCQVVVKEVMKDLQLSSEKIEMFVGESCPLTYTSYPIDCFEENISTYIDHKDIISCDKGRIYGENPGETTITFFTSDKRIVKKCSVCVLNKPSLDIPETKKKGILGFLFKK